MKSPERTVISSLILMKSLFSICFCQEQDFLPSWPEALIKLLTQGTLPSLSREVKPQIN